MDRLVRASMHVTDSHHPTGEDNDYGTNRLREWAQPVGRIKLIRGTVAPCPSFQVRVGALQYKLPGPVNKMPMVPYR